MGRRTRTEDGERYVVETEGREVDREFKTTKDVETGLTRRWKYAEGHCGVDGEQQLMTEYWVCRC